MTFSSRAVAALVCFVPFVMGACGGGGSGSGATTPLEAPAAPTDVVAIEDDGAVTLAWTEVEGADEYDVYWSTVDGVLPTNGAPLEDVQSPFDHGGLSNDVPYYYVVVARNAAGASPPSNQVSAVPTSLSSLRFFPAWWDAPPTLTTTFSYDGSKSTTQNGALLAARIHTLVPGQKLVVGGGRWTMPANFAIELQGTEDFPIWIVAAAGANTLLVGGSSASATVSLGGVGTDLEAQYVCLRGLEITGGAFGIDVRKASHCWIDRCHVHHTGGSAIHATSANTHHINVTRCEVHDTQSWGEGIVFGDNNLGTTTHDSVIAQNHVHDTRAAIEGDGIELRHGSHSNRIVENRVHHTRYPCIFFRGTGGAPPNVFERNVCWDSLDNVMQAEAGEAIVRNNLLVGPAGNKIFDSTHNMGTLRDLTVVHNTFFSQSGYCVGLFGWDDQPGLVFANNAVYSNPVGTSGYAIAFTGGLDGGTLSGNVVVGYTPNVTTGFAVGTGLGDLEGVASWAQTYSSSEHFRPTALGALVDAGNATYGVSNDLTGALRSAPYDAGAIERE